MLGEEDLGGLCLALEQAAAYIGERQVSLAEYRRRWVANARNVRAWADSLLMRYHEEREVSLSVATTWQVTFDQLQSVARTLLEMLAWLAPDPLPQGLIDHPETKAQLRGASGVTEADVEEALAELRRYSLLSRPDETQPNSAGQVHRLVQLITRDRLSDEQRRTTLLAVLAAANACTPTESEDIRTWPVLEPLRPHVARLIEHAEQAQITDPTTRLMSVLGEFFWSKALHAQAEPLYRRALALDEQVYGPEHPTVAIRLKNLAGLLQATNRLAAAEPLMRRMAAIFHRFGQHTGHEHPSMQAGLENYRQLLTALAVPPEDNERRVQTAMQTPGPLEPITPEVERLLGPAQPVLAALAALDVQYQQDHTPAVWGLPPDQPIAPYLDELLGPSALDLPLDQPIGSHLEVLLGPARATQEVLDALDHQYREQGKSPVWFLPSDEPISPHLDELLGPVAEGNAEKGQA